MSVVLDLGNYGVSELPEVFHLCDHRLPRTQPAMRSASKSDTRGRSRTDNVARLERRNRREVCDEVGYPKDQLACIRTLQDFTSDGEPDVKCMGARHFILRDDRRPKGPERIEALSQRPLTRGHLYVARTYIVH